MADPIPPADPAASGAARQASFRGVGPRDDVGDALGVLKQIPGRWAGQGFNLTARPDFQGGKDIFLELNLTQEALEFHAIGSPIPNRGSAQNDINLFGVHYLQQISDATDGGALHIEPGIWLNIPATSAPALPASIARLACIPHGDALNAQGHGITVAGGPKIEPANTVPFQVGGATPGPGAPNTFPQYDLGAANPFRTSTLPAAITQAVVNDPNTLLTAAIQGQTIASTDVLMISTTPTGATAGTGGVENIPFITTNADAAFVSAIFWVETVEHPGGTFLQLQYTQTVLLNFLGLSWPHVSVATLTKTF